jgi:hypothetical protein
MAKKAKAKKARRPVTKAKKAARKAGRPGLRAADPHPCYTQSVPGGGQVQCCWDESINDYRCRPI